ncbi:MAG: lipopolysaccharide transport periplasmic protein LptA [Lautropia sp.]|nr:lipopolysaccharide transport periplasmic protein LptA [Lautropia sp.]
MTSAHPPVCTPLHLPLAMLVSALVLCSPASAERADRDKPINIESNRLEYNDATKVSTVIGNVVLTKGTIRIQGNRMVLKQVGENAQTVQVTGNQASFRQKRDGMEQYIHGLANEIFYDTRTEQVSLIGRARLHRQNCHQPADEITGGRIVYNATSETFTVDGKPQGSGANTGGGRVRIIIQPQGETKASSGKAAPCPPGSPLPLNADPRFSGARQGARNTLSP